MYYKGTYQECIDYDNQVTIGEKINDTYPNDNYANPIEIDGEFYILKHENYNSEMELVDELPPQNLEIDG